MKTIFKRYGVELRAGNPHSPFNDGGMFTRLDWDYELYANDRPICKGDDFSPPGLQGAEYYQSVCDLLCFLTLQPGDTDDKFFSDHTPEHLAWLKTAQAEDVRMWVFMVENRSAANILCTNFAKKRKELQQ